VVLVRHAETELNARNCYQARVDVVLNATGMAQARAAASALRADRWAAGVWTSPARRATATAAALADVVGAVPRELPELLERDLGALDGQDKAGHRLSHPVDARRLEVDPSYAPPGGESLTQVLARLGRGLAHVVGETPDMTGPDARAVLVVTHGGVLNALAVGVLGGAGARPVGNVRAVSLVLHGGCAGGTPTGTVHHWDVAPYSCEYRWPAARAQPRPISPAVPSQREASHS
jgi:probable phosphoglycerate mutase